MFLLLNKYMLAGSEYVKRAVISNKENNSKSHKEKRQLCHCIKFFTKQRLMQKKGSSFPGQIP